ncbi:MAG: hypothetical protein BGO43_13065 [Gammaproteobacteria bacterium 39-13]|nr:hypothetical protein [Gammaproteobacteria bacterium]OJV93730.1 MAG: hypothetical protein BGO43_13065 [Gammaproteobacteria bacterium 39-13]
MAYDNSKRNKQFSESSDEEANNVVSEALRSEGSASQAEIKMTSEARPITASEFIKSPIALLKALIDQFRTNPKKDKQVKRPKVRSKLNQQVTDEDTYFQKLSECKIRLSELKAKAGDCEDILEVFDNANEQAEDPTFDKKGNLDFEEQPVRSRLQLLLWQEKKLKQVFEIDNKDQLSNLKKELIEKVQDKLSKISNKPLF